MRVARFLLGRFRGFNNTWHDGGLILGQFWRVGGMRRREDTIEVLVSGE